MPQSVSHYSDLWVFQTSDFNGMAVSSLSLNVMLLIYIAHISCSYKHLKVCGHASLYGFFWNILFYVD